MRQHWKVMLGATFCLAAGASAHAAPVSVLTLPYSIGSLSRALQVMGDGSVRIACDGSVLVACDGSVVPVPNASAAVTGDGSVRLLTEITLFGDGSVRAGDGSVMPGQDVLVLRSLAASPNPFLSASITAVDEGDATTFSVAFITALSGVAEGFSYILSGSADLEDLQQPGISMTPISLAGVTSLVRSLVDGSGVAALGTEALSAPGTYALGPTSGTGSCVACDTQTLLFGFTGSGGGDRLTLAGTFDITPVPAPAPLGLLAVGLLGLAAVSRRRR